MKTHFLQVSAHLKPGGAFIVTTMDCRVLAEGLAELVHGPYDESSRFDSSSKDNNTAAGITSTTVNSNSSDVSSGTIMNTEMDVASEAAADPFKRIKEIAVERAQNELIGDKTLSFNNDVGVSVLRIKFAKDMWTRLLQRNKFIANVDGGENSDKTKETDKAGSPYGIQYSFTLRDSEEDAAVDAPEWVVPLNETLNALAKAHGMRLLVAQNFQDIMNDMMQNSAKVGRLVFADKTTTTQLFFSYLLHYTI